MRFRQQQTDFAALVGDLPGFFQQRQRIHVITGFDEFDSLACFQLFFARQHFLQQRANNLFRLRALESIYRLTVLEQINRRDRAQTKLGGDHLFGVAVQLSENKLTVILGGKALQYRR